MKGIRQRARADAAAAESLGLWLERLRVDHASRILAVDDEVAIECGRIAAIRPRNMADGLIAATAIVNRKTLVTRNVADFSDLDIPLINPWV